MSDCEVVAISREEASQVILKYEWLGTMNTAYQFGYGLTDGNELLGAVCFGSGSGTRSSLSICGEEYAPLTVCLERGACVHYAHEHSGSHLISAACRMAARDHGKRIFYAYSDRAAGEIGTLYQACNWLYIGVNGRPKNGWRWEYISQDGRVVNSRTMRARVRKSFGDSPAPLKEYWSLLKAEGWERRRAYDRSRYVRFEGSKTEKKNLRKALLVTPLPYPKRDD